MPSNRGWLCENCSVFQPICGIFKAASVGVMTSTSPGIQPNPVCEPCSRPLSASNCMPPANSEEGPAALKTASAWRRSCQRRWTVPDNSRQRRPLPAVRSGSPCYAIRIGRNGDGCVNFTLSRGPLERLRRRMQIARLIIDYRNKHWISGRRPRQSAYNG